MCYSELSADMQRFLQILFMNEYCISIQVYNGESLWESMSPYERGILLGVWGYSDMKLLSVNRKKSSYWISSHVGAVMYRLGMYKEL